MKLRLFILALAALSSPVFASTTASVAASNFEVTLKDINAIDGVNPSLVWDAAWKLSGSSSYAAQTGYQTINSGTGLSAVYSPTVRSSSSLQAPNAALSGSALNGVGSFSISLGAGASPTMAAQLSIGSGVNSTAASTLSRGFTLTAGSQVSFSVLVDSDVSGSAYAGTLPSDIANAPMHSFAHGVVNMAVGSITANFNVSGGNDFVPSGTTAAYEVVGVGDRVKLTIRNNGTTEQHYLFSLGVGVSAQELLDPAAAVPEPSSYALMALGLLGVAAAVRRHKGNRRFSMESRQ